MVTPSADHFSFGSMLKPCQRVLRAVATGRDGDAALPVGVRVQPSGDPPSAHTVPLVPGPPRRQGPPRHLFTRLHSHRTCGECVGIRCVFDFVFVCVCVCVCACVFSMKSVCRVSSPLVTQIRSISILKFDGRQAQIWLNRAGGCFTFMPFIIVSTNHVAGGDL